jgi:hypothetical protein
MLNQLLTPLCVVTSIDRLKNESLPIYRTYCNMGTLPMIVQNQCSLSVDNPANIQSYQWFYNGVALSEEDNPSYTATNNGSYSVEVAYSSTCKASLNAVELNCLPVADVNEQTLGFTLAPNPATDEVQLQALNTDQIKEVLVTDLIGKTIYFQSSFASSFSVKTWPKGIYILTVKTNQQQQSLKLMVN